MARPSPQTDRVVAVIRLLAAHPEQGFTISEIARRLQLHKATCHPMLVALAGSGWLDRDPATKQYRLGPGLVAIGEAAGRSVPAAASARPSMLALSERFGVTCAAFARTSGDEQLEQVTLADQVWDVRSTVPPLRIGQRIPLRAPFGAVFVAWADGTLRTAWLAGTADAARQHYDEALAAVRRRGYAVELRTAPVERTAAAGGVARDPADTALDEVVAALVDEPEFLPVTLDPQADHPLATVVAPVFDAEGSVCLGLALLGFPGRSPTPRIDEIGQALRHAADQISATLAGRPGEAPPPPRRAPAMDA